MSNFVKMTKPYSEYACDPASLGAELRSLNSEDNDGATMMK